MAFCLRRLCVDRIADLHDLKQAIHLLTAIRLLFGYLLSYSKRKKETGAYGVSSVREGTQIDEV